MVFLPSLSTASLAIITFLSSTAYAATCTVATGGDAATAITNAFNSCKNGGTVVFTKGATYNLNSMVEVTGLKNTIVQFYGTINFPDYNTKYNGQSAYISLKGDQIHWDGANVGTINGNGQGWYNAQNHQAPTALRIQATNSYFGNFKILQSPRAHVGITTSDNVHLDHVTFETVSADSSKPAKNTDAVDISNSKNIVFTNSDLTVGDDCTAMNNDIYNVTVSNVNCNGGHGFSIGSLGKGGSTATVKTVRILSSTCTNCQNGVRIKTWPGGNGSVSDVHYENITLNKVDNPIIVTTHYCDQNQQSYCTGNDSKSLSITDVTIKGVTGSTSSASKNPVLSINCSTGTPCSGFNISGVNVSKNANTAKNECINLSGSNNISACTA
ncbi:pectin lyase fold/virulence factor [Choanephora cucurbitarum]|nr:pectin lyase fold/virulence factor [Choanephora cucurbitarum]